MARVIDTSVFIAMVRTRIPLSVVAEALAGERVAIASITASELLVGVHRSRDPASRRRRLDFVESILQGFRILPFDLEAARTHSRMSVALAASGESIGAHDLIIAATALARDYGIVTYNLRHFERVRELDVSVPSW